MRRARSTSRYKLNGLDIAANVYTPANFDPDRKYPAIVVAHPNGGVKEQVAGLFAQRLAEQGYVTIAMDAAYQGASGGVPRNTDKPQYRTEDIHGAADFITNHAGVDAQRLGLLGICGGGGYSLAAAKADKRFKSVATLSMFNSGRVRRNGFEDSQLNRNRCVRRRPRGVGSGGRQRPLCRRRTSRSRRYRSRCIRRARSTTSTPTPILIPAPLLIRAGPIR